MSLDLANLKAKAEAARDARQPGTSLTNEFLTFVDDANPGAVLELIAEIERLRATHPSTIPAQTEQQGERNSALRAEPASQHSGERAALERAAEYLEHYAKYLYEVKLEDIERHPYIPSIEESASELRAMVAKGGLLVMAKTAETRMDAGSNGGLLVGVNSVEASAGDGLPPLPEAKLYDTPAGPMPRYTATQVRQAQLDAIASYIKAGGQGGEDAQDAARFRRAITLEDNAESLYAAVMNHAPDGGAIRREFDSAAIAKVAGGQVESGKDAARYRALVEAAHAHITGKPMTPQQAAVHDAVKQLGYRTGVDDLGNAIDAAIAAREPR